MADDVLVTKDLPGEALYLRTWNQDGEFWNSDTPAFEPYDAANKADYRLAYTEAPADSGIYVLTYPSGVPAGKHYEETRRRAGTVDDEDEDEVVEVRSLSVTS